jgi:hypothetical protein
MLIVEINRVIKYFTGKGINSLLRKRSNFTLLQQKKCLSCNIAFDLNPIEFENRTFRKNVRFKSVCKIESIHNRKKP